MDGDHLGGDDDIGAAICGFLEAQDGAAGDELVLEDPEQRSAASNLLMPLGQVAGGEVNLLATPGEPFADFLKRLRAVSDLGDRQRH